jgi:hypothetical protein
MQRLSHSSGVRGRLEGSVGKVKVRVESASEWVDVD